MAAQRPVDLLQDTVNDRPTASPDPPSTVRKFTSSTTGGAFVGRLPPGTLCPHTFYWNSKRNKHTQGLGTIFSICVLVKGRVVRIYIFTSGNILRGGKVFGGNTFYCFNTFGCSTIFGNTIGGTAIYRGKVFENKFQTMGD